MALHVDDSHRVVACHQLGDLHIVAVSQLDRRIDRGYILVIHQLLIGVVAPAKEISMRVHSQDIVVTSYQIHDILEVACTILLLAGGHLSGIDPVEASAVTQLSLIIEAPGIDGTIR